MKSKLKILSALAAAGILLSGCMFGEGDPENTEVVASGSAETASGNNSGQSPQEDETSAVMGVYSGEGYSDFALEGGASVKIPAGVTPVDLFSQEAVSSGANSITFDANDNSSLILKVYPEFMTPESLEELLAYRLETAKMVSIYSNVEYRDLQWDSSQTGKVISYLEETGPDSKDHTWMLAALKGEAVVTMTIRAPEGNLKNSEAFKSASTFVFAN